MSMKTPINCYTCAKCGKTIVTVDRAEGVTPFYLNCRATPNCEGVMRSHMYQVDQTLAPQFEWYKPRKPPRGVMYEHVQMGGLLIREIQ